MMKPMPSSKMIAETLDPESPDGLDQTLRILAELLAKEYERRHGQRAPQVTATEVPPCGQDKKLLDIDGIGFPRP